MTAPLLTLLNARSLAAFTTSGYWGDETLYAIAARQARAKARQLRPRYRLPAKQRERLSELLAKGNAGLLTAAESAELDRLVVAFEKKTHELALAIGHGKRRPTSG